MYDPGVTRQWRRARRVVFALLLNVALALLVRAGHDVILCPPDDTGCLPDRLEYPTTQDVIVHGHTTFVVLEKNETEGAEGFDIAILVRNVEQVGVNVAWFNDQWKTFFPPVVEYPCSGLLFGTLGNVDPIELLKQAAMVSGGTVNDTAPGVGQALNFGYEESYRIFDPNGFESRTHLYMLWWQDVERQARHEIPIWATAVQNNFDPKKAGGTCPPVVDAPAVGEPYYDPILYNADIFGLWDTVVAAEKTSHPAVNPDDTCRNEWDCPESTSPMDGYSHPYNPEAGNVTEDHQHDSSIMTVGLVETLPTDLKWLFDQSGGLPPVNPIWRVNETG